MFNVLKDETGKIYNGYTVLHRDGTNKKVRWVCQCICGNIRCIRGVDLRLGKAKSCGCMKKIRMKTHGMSGHPICNSYYEARDRCNNTKNKDYSNYGGAGIEFKLGSIYEFIEKMQPTWFKNASIGREDNNGHYEYSNIRWETDMQQARNRKTNRWLEYAGVKLTITDWAKELGMSASGLRHRITKKMWSIEKTLTTPPQKRKVKELNG